MYRQLRVISLFGFVFVGLAALVLTAFSHQTQRETLVRHGERENLGLVAVLANTLPAAVEALKQDPQNSEAHEWLDGTLVRLLAGRSVAQIGLYWPDGSRAYPAPGSGADLPEHVDPPAGEVDSALVEGSASEDVRYGVRSLVTVGWDGLPRQMIVLVDDDITALYRAVEENRWLTGLFSLAVLLALYLLLFSAIRYATRQLHRQQRVLQRSIRRLSRTRRDLEARVRERTAVLEQEVQERRRAEQLLREHEAYLSATMENLFNAIICIDSQGYVRSFNKTAERMFGYPAREMLGQKVNRLMPERYRDRHDQYLADYLRTGERHIIGSARELTGRRRDGSVFPMELAVTEATLAGQTIFVGTIRDLSEQKRQERELNEARQRHYHQEKMAAIGSLAAGLVHEIGNPTAAVSGLIDMLLEDERLSPEEMRDHLELIREQVARIIQITRDVSEFSTPQQQEAQLLDLNNLIGRTVRLMRHDRRARAIAIVLELDQSLPAVEAVGDHLIQILMNLIVNSLDAIQSAGRIDGRIVVRSGWADSRAWFEIEDNGTGMSEEVLRHAREAFYTTKPVGKGTGLGLSLCESLLAAAGGEL